jgi:hypothetical protein
MRVQPVQHDTGTDAGGHRFRVERADLRHVTLKVQDDTVGQRLSVGAGPSASPDKRDRVRGCGAACDCDIGGIPRKQDRRRRQPIDAAVGSPDRKAARIGDKVAPEPVPPKVRKECVHCGPFRRRVHQPNALGIASVSHGT